ncbi:alpha/beta fold hydrolase [Paracoccus alkanivorans]|uniref:Alpha/beta fold hydrolase n=1 Tax=Paracoccus alkanivorans TaxID=2116655 RepID=A0A3M0MIX0_9RHOB|nr:alpha/beta fold hydrolase [Paracoccus alkanivorans]RMC37549.1 alpha/beta fold hydrolase [Paracoccus alkanivorans]
MKLHLTVAAALIVLPLHALGETANVDGHEVWYEVHGDLTAEQTPVLLLHGGMMNTELAWADLIPALSQDRPVIGIDQQGHGHTADHEGPVTLETMRADTIGVLDALQVDKAHVIGFSLGGMLGLELAVNAPERVASLTAISASQNNGGMLPELVEMNRNPDHPPSPELVELLPSPKDFLEMRRGFEEQNPGGSGAMVPLMKKLGALLASDWGWSDEELAAIPVPVMIAIGDRDFIRPAHAVQLAETIPDAWLTVLPDTTHMTILDAPALPDLLIRRMETAEEEQPETTSAP